MFLYCLYIIVLIVLLFCLHQIYVKKTFLGMINNKQAIMLVLK